ncbi:hypothetical protein [Dyella thiooxydans]|uniref:hypothetical protein n=1 Tax=Dyella thiooxydans TaxID=445710 RepID=UPI0007C4F20A|nr:hypothetical protein [Dyella thiooxydans]
MDEKTRRRNSYVVASCPLVIAGMQVLFGFAPLVMLGIGACMSVVAFVMFRFLSGLRVFGAGSVQFGRATALRIWQAPIVWVPIVVGVGAMVFLRDVI